MKRVYIFLVLILFWGCQEISTQINSEYLYHEQVNKSQTNELATVNQENNYFFNLNQACLKANVEYYDDDEDEYKYKESVICAKIYLVKEYEKGDVYKLEIEPVGGIQYERLNQYFYVTEDIIYRVLPFYYNAEDNEVIIFYDDELFTETLDTDDKLINEGDIVCHTREEMKSSLEEEKDGIYYSISKHGEQITYGRLELNPNGETNYYENFVWERDKGLTEYSSGFGAMRDILYLTDITVVSEAECAELQLAY